MEGRLTLRIITHVTVRNHNASSYTVSALLMGEYAALNVNATVVRTMKPMRQNAFMRNARSP